MKRKKKTCVPKVLNLHDLVNKLAKTGHENPDDNLISDLKNRICISSDDLEHTVNLLMVQFKHPHSQIRLAALGVLSHITNPKSFSEANHNPEIAFHVRERVVLRLQELTSYILPTNSIDAPLPPPKNASDLLQLRSLQLLLSWEKDCFDQSEDESQSFSGIWHPPLKIKGQLSSLMHYLRTFSSPTAKSSRMANVRLCEVGVLLANLEAKIAQESRERIRNASTTEMVLKRNLIEAQKNYTEIKDEIDENLTSLRSALSLLVPDPFDSSISDCLKRQLSSDSILQLDSDEDPREHGILFGSSSGFGSAFSSNNIPITLEMTQQASTSDTYCLPKLHIELSDDVILLRSSCQEFSDLALKKHLPIIETYTEICQMCACNSNLSPFLNHLDEAKSYCEQLRQLTNKFCNALQFDDVNANASNSSKIDTGSAHLPTDTSSEDEDFSDVPLLPISGLPTANNEKKMKLSTPLITNKLPWEVGNQTTKPTMFVRKHKNNANTGIHLNFKKIETEVPDAVIVLSEETSKPIRTEDSSHRFWKPNDPTEFERPSTNYMETAISLNIHQFPTVQIVNSFKSSDVICSKDKKPSSAGCESPLETKILACRAPLLSGKLCCRKDPSGNCRIHGEVVRRDAKTGRPIDENVRLRLQAKQAEINRQKDQEKFQSRRHYSKLEDISGSKKRPRLHERILDPRNIRKINQTLDNVDREKSLNFCESFQRTFKQ